MFLLLSFCKCVCTLFVSHTLLLSIGFSVAMRRLFLIWPGDAQEGWGVRQETTPVLIHTGGYFATSVWPMADRVLFNTQSTLLTSLRTQGLQSPSATLLCTLYWSWALSTGPCWHAQHCCLIMDWLRGRLQHNDEIAQPRGLSTSSLSHQAEEGKRRHQVPFKWSRVGKGCQRTMLSKLENDSMLDVALGIQSWLFINQFRPILVPILNGLTKLEAPLCVPVSFFGCLETYV